MERIADRLQIRHALGIYADFGHMGLEGAYGGWVQSLDLIADRLIMLSLKNVGLFPYTGSGRRRRPSLARSSSPSRYGTQGHPNAAVSWESKFVPLKEGITPYREAFQYLKEIGYSNYASFPHRVPGRVELAGTLLS